MCSDLLEDGVEVEIMWIPSDVELEGNDIVTELSNRIKKTKYLISEIILVLF
jgi:hypothetical protein